MAAFGDSLTCDRCGAQHAPEHRFCGVCGVALQPADAGAARERPAVTERPSNASEELDRLAGVRYDPSPGAVDASPSRERDDATPFYIPTNRVIFLTALSSGLYIFYWMYVTWKHYREYTGETAFPVFHAMSLVVPVYQFFRLHAHMRVYQELMNARGVPSTLSPIRTVLTYLGVVMLGLVSFMLPTEGALTTSQQAGYVVINVGQTALLVWILWHAQTNLNRLWRHHLGARLGLAPIAPAEVIITVLGSVFGWGMLLVLLIDPTLLLSDTMTAP